MFHRFRENSYHDEEKYIQCSPVCVVSYGIESGYDRIGNGPKYQIPHEYMFDAHNCQGA